MSDFLAAIANNQMPFLRYALIAGILASVTFGIVGSYVVVRRITYIAGAIAHCVLGGIGIALYAQKVWHLAWLDPIYGALVAAILAALIIGLVSMYTKQREDTVIGAIWAIGMAVGLLFIAKTPGYIDPMSYLFGNILLVSKSDLWLMILLDIVIVTAVWLLYHNFMAVCFDEEYARLRGLNTKFYYLALLMMIALAVVLLVRVVGIVMVVALLTLPAAIAGHFVNRLGRMMVMASLLCMIFISGGLAWSYSLDLPSGPVIIVLAGGAYLITLLISRLRRR
ncbi:MAG TPA: metal ABC transporter permease [Desulfobacterales bacterium]|nr:metal ABC transporter permease [Desulfobacterales bacterium]